MHPEKLPKYRSTSPRRSSRASSGDPLGPRPGALCRDLPLRPPRRRGDGHDVGRPGPQELPDLGPPAQDGISGEKPLWRHTAHLLGRLDPGAGCGPSPYLFTGREGPLKKRWVQRLFERYAEQAEIRGRSVHCLRHSIAVHLLEAGRGLSTWRTTLATARSPTPASTPRSRTRFASRSSVASSGTRRSCELPKVAVRPDHP
jgi:hypothetical protein